MQSIINYEFNEHLITSKKTMESVGVQIKDVDNNGDNISG